MAAPVTRHATMMALPLVVAMLAGCTGGGNTLVHFETSMGDFTVQMYDDEAPITVENFLSYVDSGFYDDTLFHRIAAGFVIQGGGKDAGTGAFKPTRAPIDNEAIESGLLNEKWTLSMARTTQPDSATNQFFINLDDNEGLDPGGFSEAGYAVFGIVSEGRDVVEAIAAVEVKQFEGEPLCQNDQTPSCPVEPVIVHRVWREGGETPQPPGPPELTLGKVQQGDWHVSAARDYLLVYATNAGGPAEDVSWNLMAADGPLPDGWNATFSPATVDVGAEGARAFENGRPTYPDTQSALLTLDVPPATEGTFELVLGLGNATLDLTAIIDASGSVAAPGDGVHVGYEGRFENGEVFDSNLDPGFDTTLGSGQTVQGFDLGLAGLADGEAATLRIPPALGYGYDQTGSLAQFNGEVLVFDIMLEFDEA